MSKNIANLKMCLFLERERDLRPRGAVLGLSRGLCGRSWPSLGAYVRDLGRILGPLLAVLGRLGWSWPLLGPLGAVLGRDQARKWPTPERGQDPTGSGPEKR